VDKFSRLYLDCLEKTAVNWKLLAPATGIAAGGATGYAVSDASAKGYHLSPQESLIPRLIGTLSGAYTGGTIARKGSVGTGTRLENLMGGIADSKGAIIGSLASDAMLAPSAALVNASLQKTKQEVAQGQVMPTDAAGMWDYTKNNPGKVMAGAGVASLGAAGLYALIQAARAARRIGDGHAIRVSTSLRKRPGQSTDLNLGFSPMAPGRLPRKGQRRPGDGFGSPAALASVDEGDHDD
jgi:hypothetical protein